MSKLLMLGLLNFCILTGQAQLKPLYKIINQPQPVQPGLETDSLPLFLNPAGVCKPSMKSVQEYLLRTPYVKDANDPKQDRLISDYSFRHLIRSDFTKTVVGMDNISKINRYASLDLSDKPAFDFTPIVWNDDPKKKVFQNIFSMNISGKMNKEGFVDMKKLRDLTLKFNFIHIFGLTNYKPNDRVAVIKNQLYCDTHKDIAELCKKYEGKFDDVCDGKCVSDPTKKEKKRKELVNSFIAEFVELETKSAEKYWRSKNYYWLSVNVGVKRDKVDFANKDEINQNIYNVQHETIFTPEVQAAVNGLNMYASGLSILYSISAAIKQKHSLSEVYSPDDFQPYFPVTPTTLQLKDKEEVFVTDFTDIDEKWMPDFGGRAVFLSPYIIKDRKQQIGISFAASRKGLVHTSNSAALYRVELGAVFPFLKEDGSSKFNLELFHRWDEYSKFPNEDENTWGFRFNVPISK